MQEVKINKNDSAFTVSDETMLILSPGEVYSARVTAGITGQGKTPVQAVKNWQAAGCPMHERPEPASVDTSDQVAATVTYRVIGKRGAMLKEIGQQARADIERMLDAKVFLELWVKVKEGWRNNQYQMRNIGYEDQ